MNEIAWMLIGMLVLLIGLNALLVGWAIGNAMKKKKKSKSGC